MKYYSETLHKFYDTEEALKKEEKAAEDAALAKQKEENLRKAARTKASKEVEEKIKAAAAARKEADEAISNFVKEYGNYHCTLKDTDAFSLSPFFDLFDFWS